MRENFPKSTKNSKFDHGNFSDESLDQDKPFKHVIGVGVGWEFEKMWMWPTFTGSYKKKECNCIILFNRYPDEELKNLKILHLEIYKMKSYEN